MGKDTKIDFLSQIVKRHKDGLSITDIKEVMGY